MKYGPQVLLVFFYELHLKCAELQLLVLCCGYVVHLRHQLAFIELMVRWQILILGIVCDCKSCTIS